MRISTTTNFAMALFIAVMCATTTQADQFVTLTPDQIEWVEVNDEDAISQRDESLYAATLGQWEALCRAG